MAADDYADVVQRLRDATIQFEAASRLAEESRGEIDGLAVTAEGIVNVAIRALGGLLEDEADWAVCDQAIEEAEARWIYPVLLRRALRGIEQEGGS